MKPALFILCMTFASLGQAAVERECRDSFYQGVDVIDSAVVSFNKVNQMKENLNRAIEEDNVPAYCREAQKFLEESWRTISLYSQARGHFIRANTFCSSPNSDTAQENVDALMDHINEMNIARDQVGEVVKEFCR